jgi:catechol 2,3-dioxygenase-like lactoylglutathione lyase family enzyme
MRILHTMLRVGDMARSVKFYTEVLGMKLLRGTTVIAFVEDPDGYKIEFIERKTGAR